MAGDGVGAANDQWSVRNGRPASGLEREALTKVTLGSFAALRGFEVQPTACRYLTCMEATG